MRLGERRDITQDRPYKIEDLVACLLAENVDDEFLITTEALHHAIHRFQAYLVKRRAWIVEYTRADYAPVPAYGTSVQVKRRYTVRFSEPQKTTHSSAEKIQYRNTVMHNANQFVHGKGNTLQVNPHKGSPTLAALCIAEVSAQLAEGSARLEEAAAESSADPIVPEKKRKSSLISSTKDSSSSDDDGSMGNSMSGSSGTEEVYIAEKVRSIIRVDVHTNSVYTERQRVLHSHGGTSAECRALVDSTKDSKVFNSTHYQHIGSLPTYLQRREQVIQHAPILYTTIYDALISGHHKSTSARAHNRSGKKSEEEYSKENEHFDERSEKIMRDAVDMVELITAIHSGGQIITYFKVMVSVMCYLNGITRTGMDLLAAMHITVAFTTVVKIVDGWLESRQKELLEEIDNMVQDEECCPLVIVDNYAVQSYQRFTHLDKKFTQSTPTIAVLVKKLPKRSYQSVLLDSTVTSTSSSGVADEVRAPAVNIPTIPPAFREFSMDRLCEVICGNGIIIPVHMKGIVDDNKDYQGLRNYRVYPNISGKSSSYADTQSKVIDNLLNKKFRMDKRVVVVMLDPEYLLTFYRSMVLDPVGMANVLPGLPIFHLLMHTTQNKSNDPTNLTMLYLPMNLALGLQTAKNEKKMELALTLMEKYVNCCIAAVNKTKRDDGTRLRRSYHPFYTCYTLLGLSVKSPVWHTFYGQEPCQKSSFF